MKKIILSGLLLQLFLLPANILSQNDVWKTYLSFTDERAMAFFKNEIWIGYLHGLIKFDTLTKKAELFTKKNSSLSGNMVSSVAIDSGGVKWVAANEEDQNLLRLNTRLSSYDGLKWTVYKEGDALLGKSLIVDLAIDSKGVKWIAALDSGLISFDGSIWKKYFEHIAGKNSNRFLSVRIDKQDTKWFGCDSGLIKYDGNKFTLFIPPLEKKTIGDFAIDDSGNIWAAAHDGLLSFNGSIWTHIIYQPSFDVSHITADRAGNIWMLHKGYLLKYDRLSWTKFDTANSNIPFQKIIDLKILKDGSWWIFSRDGRFAVNRKFSENPNSQWTVYTNSEASLPFDYPGVVAADLQGHLWIGSLDYGLLKYDGRTWTSYTVENSGLPSNYIHPVIADKYGNVWIGTGASIDPNKMSLTKFDGENWTVYDSIFSPAGSVLSIVIDPKGTKWVSTNESWLFSYNDTLWKHYTPDNTPIPYGNVTSLASDSSGNIWFASVSWPKGNNLGLVKYDGKNWTTYKMENDIEVTSVACDKNGPVWLGTLSNGLIRFDGINWKVFPDIPYISSMAFDKEGVLWIAAKGFGMSQGGLIKFKDSTWTTYNTHNSGLSSLHLSEIAIDQYGNKWITTNGDGLIFFGKENQPPSGVKSNGAYDNKFTLSQNYPNPFNPSTTIKYELAKKRRVSLRVYDIMGKMAAELINGEQNEGPHEIKYTASGLASGIYIYRLQSENNAISRKFLFLK